MRPRRVQQFFQRHTAKLVQAFRSLHFGCDKTWDKKTVSSLFPSHSLNIQMTMYQANKFCPGVLRNSFDSLGSSLQVILNLCKTNPLFSTRALALCYQRIFKRLKLPYANWLPAIHEKMKINYLVFRVNLDSHLKFGPHLTIYLLCLND